MRIRPKYPRSRRIVAEEELELKDDFVEEDFDDADLDDAPAKDGGVNVAAEASDLLFEAEDVAELIAEVTGEAVEVTADDDVVTFKVAEDEFTVTPEGDEEVLEATRRPLRGKRAVRASRAARPVRKPVRASSTLSRPARRPVSASRRIPRSSRRISK